MKFGRQRIFWERFLLAAVLLAVYVFFSTVIIPISLDREEARRKATYEYNVEHGWVGQ